MVLINAHHLLTLFGTEGALSSGNFSFSLDRMVIDCVGSIAQASACIWASADASSSLESYVTSASIFGVKGHIYGASFNVIIRSDVTHHEISCCVYVYS